MAFNATLEGGSSKEPSSTDRMRVPKVVTKAVEMLARNKAHLAKLPSTEECPGA